jgi:hypothetical protein
VFTATAVPAAVYVSDRSVRVTSDGFWERVQTQQPLEQLLVDTKKAAKQMWLIFARTAALIEGDGTFTKDNCIILTLKCKFVFTGTCIKYIE